VPSDYHEFADVFDKGKASQLPPHCPYDLKINLEEGSAPPLGTIFLLVLLCVFHAGFSKLHRVCCLCWLQCLFWMYIGLLLYLIPVVSLSLGCLVSLVFIWDLI
jgi:hypothetical protein